MTEQKPNQPLEPRAQGQDNGLFRARRVRNTLAATAYSIGVLTGGGVVLAIDTWNRHETMQPTQQLAFDSESRKNEIQHQDEALVIDVSCPTDEETRIENQLPEGSRTTTFSIGESREVVYYSDVERLDGILRTFLQNEAIPLPLRDNAEAIKSGSLENVTLNLEGSPETRYLYCDHGITFEEHKIFNYNVLPFEEIGPDDYAGPFIEAKDRIDSNGRHITEVSFFIDDTGEILTKLPNRLSSMGKDEMIELVSQIVNILFGEYEDDKYGLYGFVARSEFEDRSYEIEIWPVNGFVQVSLEDKNFYEPPMNFVMSRSNTRL